MLSSSFENQNFLFDPERNNLEIQDDYGYYASRDHSETQMNSHENVRDNPTEEHTSLGTRGTRHTRCAEDNMINKIKAAFTNYLLIYINQLIKIFFNNQKFRIWKVHRKEQINSNATKEFNKELFGKTLGTIFSAKLSEKYKTKDEDQNKKNIETLMKYPFFKELFQMTYYEFYMHHFLSQDEHIKNKLIQHLNDLDEKQRGKKEKIQNLKMGNLDTFLEGLQGKRKPNESDEEHNSYLEKVKNKAFHLPIYFGLTDLMSKNENAQRVNGENTSTEQNQLVNSNSSHIVDEGTVGEENQLNTPISGVEQQQLNDSQKDDEKSFVNDLFNQEEGNENTRPGTGDVNDLYDGDVNNGDTNEFFFSIPYSGGINNSYDGDDNDFSFSIRI